MAIDQVGQAEANAQMSRRLVNKKNEIQDTENNLEAERHRAENAGKQKIQSEIEKNEANLVSISKEGAAQAEKMRTQFKAQNDAMNQHSSEQFQTLAQNAAERIRQLDQEAANQISNYQKGKMEKVANVTTRGEDPFYNLKSFNAQVSESETEYKVSVKLPAHEAQNLFVTSDNNQLKLSLARQYEGSQKFEDQNKSNRTYSYQTILENITLPGRPDMKKVTREYADGQLTIRIGKFI